MFRKLARVTASAVIGLSLLAGPAIWSARASGGDVRREGSCTGHSDWRLEVQRQDANTLEVRFRIDNAPSGAEWEIFLSDNGTRFFAGTRTSDGDVRVRKNTRDRAGTDRIKAYGLSHATGEVCSGRVAFDG